MLRNPGGSIERGGRAGRMADPGINAAAMLRIRIAALPGELREAFLEADAVLA